MVQMIEVLLKFLPGFASVSRDARNSIRLRVASRSGLVDIAPWSSSKLVYGRFKNLAKKIGREEVGKSI